MRRALACLLTGALLAGAGGPLLAAPAAGRAPATHSSTSLASAPLADVIAQLANVDTATRQAAEQRLARTPRDAVVQTAVAMVEGRTKAADNPDLMASPAAVALDVLVRLDNKKAVSLALGLVDTRDPFLREAAATIVGQLDDDAAVPFLARALRQWGLDTTAGMRPVILGLAANKRAENPQVRAAIVGVLTLQPLPARNPKFTYDSPHDTPRDGDQYRCWQFKADGCLELVALHPFAEANDGVRRCLLIDELRVAAALAFARLGQAEAAHDIRTWLDRDHDTEHRLGLYRALFIVGGDTPEDRLAARDMFTATQAPSPAWILGLRAMVELFDHRTDEPALRVVSLWKLKGEAAALRKAALEVMKTAHPEVYEKVLGKSYVPPELR